MSGLSPLTSNIIGKTSIELLHALNIWVSVNLAHWFWLQQQREERQKCPVSKRTPSHYYWRRNFVSHWAFFANEKLGGGGGWTAPFLSFCHFLVNTKNIHVKSPSLGGRLPLFYPISLLNIHLPPKNWNLPLFETHFLPIIFASKRMNCIEFCNENALLSQQNINQVQ